MKNNEYSKSLLKQESALIWILSISFIMLAFYCIHKGFAGSLPWLSAMVGFPWTAYGVSQAMYYKKSMAENTTGGIKYETVLEEAKKIKDYYNGNSTTYPNFNFDDVTTTYTTTTTYTASENPDDYQI